MANKSLSDQQYALLQKYLAGNCTPDEKVLVETWYASFDGAPLPDPQLEEASLKAVKEHVFKVAGKGRRFTMRALLRIAAVFILLVSMGSAGYYWFSGTGNTYIYIAKNGEQKTVVLSDGTTVSLNSGSSIELLPGYNKQQRGIKLSGEAFFEVAKNPGAPFIVSTGAIATVVLGTSFNVQAYPEEEHIQVTVKEGKVRVDKQKSAGATLLPNDRLTYEKETGRSLKAVVDADRVIAWRNGKIYFENESIPQIARKLERKYGVKIDVKGPVVADCKYTLWFSDEPLSKALEVLSTVSGMKYHFTTNSHLIINTATCK